MTTITATEFRKELFRYLDMVEAGETVLIKRNNQAVARLVPDNPRDWRKSMENRVEILVDADTLMQPIEGVWDDYI